MNKDDILLLVLVLVLFGAGFYAVFNKDGLLVASNTETAEMTEEEVKEKFERKKPLPILGKAPEITGIVDWIGTEPLANEDLKGKVVLVDFWTYSCINCIRTLPYLTSWYEKYEDKGFVLLGVHTPEFDFEKKKSNIIESMAERGVTYPVAMDNDYATWNSFSNRYWPAHYLIDVDGNIRYTHFGEGKYQETEENIQQLLIEGGLAEVSDFTGGTSEEEKKTSGVETPETYFGYKRIANFGSAADDIEIDKPYSFPSPSTVTKNRFYLEGDWVIGPESAEFVGDTGKILMNYKANQANIVFESDAGVIEAEVLLDGEYMTVDNGGSDVLMQDGKSVIKVDSSRLYNLVDQEKSDWHTLEVRVKDKGLKAFAFTFG